MQAHSAKVIAASTMLDDDSDFSDEVNEAEEEVAEQESFDIEIVEFTAEEREQLYNAFINETRGRTKPQPPTVKPDGTTKNVLQWSRSKASEITQYLEQVYHAKEVHHTYDYNKNVHAWTKVYPSKAPFYTGFSVYMKDTKLICVDFDIDKSLPYNKRIELRNSYIHKIVMMVRRPDLLLFDFSANGGFHVWLRNDVKAFTDACTMDRSIKLVKHAEDNEDEDPLDVDFFIPKDFGDKNPSGVVLPFSIVNVNDGKSEKANYRCYTMPKHIPEEPYTYSWFAQDINSWIHFPQTLEEFIAKFTPGPKTVKGKQVVKKPAPTKPVEQAPIEQPVETPKKTYDIDIDNFKLEDLEFDEQGRLISLNTPSQPSVQPSPQPSVEEAPIKEEVKASAQPTIAFKARREEVKQAVEEDVKDEVKDEISTLEETDEEDRPQMPLAMFEAIVGGLTQFTIHGDCSASVDVEPALLHIISGLFACVGTHVSKEDVNDACQHIKVYGKLTPSASARIDKEYMRQEIEYDAGRGQSHPGCLFKALKTFAPEYYDKTVKPHFKEYLNKDFDFVTEEFSYTDFRKNHNAGMYRSYYDYMRGLAHCFAIDNDSNGMIIKIVDRERDDEVIFKAVSKDYVTRNYSIAISYPPTKADKARYENSKHKCPERISSSLAKLVFSDAFRRYAKAYNGIKIAPKAGTLSLWRPPPKTQYDRKLIDDWMAFYNNVVVHQAPFKLLIDSVCYRMRNRSSFIEKFFINYGEGFNGKSFLAHCLSLVFPNCSNPAIQQAQVTRDIFNSWMSNSLFNWLEEVEKSQSYDTEAIINFIKLCTTHESSVRGHYKETRRAFNWAVCGMNTNKDHLYGIAWSLENSIKSRVVVIEYKSMPADYIRKSCARFANDPNFAYSLYYYLMKDHQLDPNFTPSRAESPESLAYFERSKKLSKNSVMEWLREKGQKWFCGVVKVGKVDHYCAPYDTTLKAYQIYVKGKAYAIKDPEPMLNEFGFIKKKTTINYKGERKSGYNCFLMECEAFNKAIALIRGEEEGDDTEITVVKDCTFLDDSIDIDIDIA